ncbi:FCD domain-containing protein [Ahrensia kielensis]|uniref:FCD domain-containing protein n=1 Tax=Ahrensia kielensis TaxID=76980 RepID=A0ABU9TAL3_9HYPH
MNDQLTELATRKLRTMIDHPRWREGGKLPPEEALAKTLSISRPALRRALEIMRQEDRVVSQRGSGNYVRASETDAKATFLELDVSSIADVENCIRFRYGLEVAMAGEAAERATEAAISRIETANHFLSEEITEGSQFDADFEVHICIAQATQNPYYVAAMQSLRAPMQVCYEIGRSLRGVPLTDASRRVFIEHRQIIKAITSHNPKAARAAMDLHLGATMNRFLGKSDGV